MLGAVFSGLRFIFVFIYFSLHLAFSRLIALQVLMGFLLFQFLAFSAVAG